jgi:ABC-2 type transport system permease protein
VSESRILEGGYRRYDGPRLGVGRAVTSVVQQTVKHILGLRRQARSKALPILAIVIAYLPAATFVGLVALLPKRVHFVIPSYSEYYGFVTAAITLFALFAAPEALCPDRRTRVLSLYLASPLTRGTYLLAKAAAVMGVMLFVTLGPPLLLLVGLSLQGEGPDGVAGMLGVLGRIVAAGLALAGVYTAVSLAVASLTDRRAFAAGGALLLILGSGAVSAALDFGAGLGHNVLLLSVHRAPFELVQRIYGRPGFFPSLSTLPLALAVAAMCALGGLTAWWRYQRLQITR